MIVLIAGMQRSGSTFSFNIVRELLARRGPTYQEPAVNILPVLERAGNSAHVLIKAHRVDDTTIQLVRLGAIKVICTVRKPEDAIASWMEAFRSSLDDAISELRAWFVLFEQIRQHSLIVDYDSIDRRPRRTAWAIARHICPEASMVEAFRIAARYSKANVFSATRELRKDAADIQDIGFSYYDTKTFFHRRHVSSLVTKPAVARVGEAAVKTIRQALCSHLDQNGNIRQAGEPNA